MIRKETVDQLPTKLREELINYLSVCKDKAKGDRDNQALAYVATADEKHRSASLIAQGELDAFSVLYNVFKN